MSGQFPGAKYCFLTYTCGQEHVYFPSRYQRKTTITTPFNSKVIVQNMHWAIEPKIGLKIN